MHKKLDLPTLDLPWYHQSQQHEEIGSQSLVRTGHLCTSPPGAAQHSPPIWMQLACARARMPCGDFGMSHTPFSHTQPCAAPYCLQVPSLLYDSLELEQHVCPGLHVASAE